MSEGPSNGTQVVIGRAVRGSLIGLGLFVGSVGVANEGASRILGVLLGVLAIVLAFTSVSAKFAERMSTRSSAKVVRFWAMWISGGTVVVPLIAAFFPVLALAGGVPMNLTFGSLIVGAGLCSLLNLVVLLSNLIGYRSA
jgi:hypothetical protein